MENYHKTSDTSFSSDGDLMPELLHQGNFTELMPVSQGYYDPMYLTSDNTMQASSPGVNSSMDQYTTISEHRILGKRKRYQREVSDFDDDSIADNKSVRTNDDKKQNHSEIEKRRRDKMNTYISELATMIPMCHANPRKLDKLTVLRMAVQHLRSVRGAVHSYTEGHYKPSFLSDEELKHLILQAADGFLFVVGCDRGRILFISESVSNTLYYSQGDLLGQSWFDILHPKDVAKIKEQLSSSDLSPRERLIDAKTMLPVKTDMPLGATRLGPGARRSFLCRMKCKSTVQVQEEADTTTTSNTNINSVSASTTNTQTLSQRSTRKGKVAGGGADRRYCVVHCTGYMKSWTPAKIDLAEEPENETDSERCNLSCLVAVGRVQSLSGQNKFLSAPPSTSLLYGDRPRLRPVEFVSRHAHDGTFLFVDIRATAPLGYLPQELIGTSIYEYFHHDDIRHLSETHLAALQTYETRRTQCYRFRTKDGSYIKLRSDWRPFKNPWTKDIDYLISKNTVITATSEILESMEETQRSSNLTSPNNGGASSSILGGSSSRLTIINAMEASLIGQQVAKEAARKRRNENGSSSSTGSTPSPTATHHPDDQSHHSSHSCTESSSLPSNLEEMHHSQLRTQLNGLSGLQNVASAAIRNNVTLASTAADQGSSDQEMMEMLGPAAMPHSPQVLPVTSEGNDEAAMAVIMSLLEADAGLGGPVDFSGLPWPLP